VTLERRRALLAGQVQGVGLRPFVAALARALELVGHVRNDAGGVEVEVEGTPRQLDHFAERLLREAPPAARIERATWTGGLAPRAEPAFTIGESRVEVAPHVGVAPDLRVCEACLAEVRDPDDRRFAHPFTTCLACGPRFSVTRALPYDRARTSMQEFSPCLECRAEHDQAGGRRHHAQALACPRCGPRLRLRGGDGAPHGQDGAALAGAIAALRRGQIVALQGVGGFQLLVDASDEAAVLRLRARKRRPSKPLAVMVASLAQARSLAALGDEEARALASPAGPIVLLRRRADGLAPAVAPRCARLGLMLPTTPLHALLLDALARPLVATSGNRHEEPIALDEAEALQRLADIADVFLVHDRAIVRRCDDSVVQIAAGRARVLRLGRGYAPLRIPLAMHERTGETLLALGGHLKHAPVLVADGEAIVWPHVGDLDGPAARAAMVRSLEDLERTAGRRAACVVVDAHPDYATTAWAEASGRPLRRVWHHHAHVAATLAEHGVDAALGFAWDGVGLGPDGGAWGGEALAVDAAGARRVAHLLPFPLPGGDAAARDGGRVLAGMLAAAGLPPPPELPELARWLPVAARAQLCPASTSVGRLFDAVAALVGVCPRSRHEGEAAARLEDLAEEMPVAPYPFVWEGAALDWRPMLAAMLVERHDPPRVAARLHATLCAMVVDVARRRRAGTVALGGGCFQNRRLVEAIDAALGERGVRVLIPTRVPPSDGGLALGQAWVATRSAPCA
jgi:hydrogenase maturation protein HypF